MEDICRIKVSIFDPDNEAKKGKAVEYIFEDSLHSRNSHEDIAEIAMRRYRDLWQFSSASRCMVVVETIAQRTTWNDCSVWNSLSSEALIMNS